MEDSGHKPVLLKETLELIVPRPGGVFFDGTVGGGGHSYAILRESSPDGILYGCDRDGEELIRTEKRLKSVFRERCQLRYGNYSEVKTLFPGILFDGALLDLGCSSMQMDQKERGFSFSGEAVLDMRMDRQGGGVTAADIINSYEEEELSRIFFEYGGESESRRLARIIVQERGQRPFRTTRQLAELIERRVPRRGKKIHPATKVFQALRIEVNTEFEHLRRGLESLLEVIKSGGKLAVITFHSGEDRIVKEFGKFWARDYIFEGEVDIPELRRWRSPVLRVITRKPIEPSDEELAKNPRSRSAKLRVYEKL